ncbi:putative L-glutamate gamma-semialdehyde dehydrogenase [Helianthus annuus]|nr:putative L-glutamate gamma-semialdehyde dehydrogenase [Helianthus annuus]
MARWFRVRGDQLGNQSHGFGWPYGPVALVTPFSFSFPVKIPAVQLMGALYMGIKLVLRVDKNNHESSKLALTGVVLRLRLTQIGFNRCRINKCLSAIDQDQVIS